MSKTELRRKVTNFFDNPESLAAKSIQGLIIILILTTGADFFIELLAPEYYSVHKATFNTLETIIVAVFTAEYIIRLWAAENRFKFITNFYNVIDLLAIAPFYIHILNLSILRGARLTRLLRLARLLRLVKLFKYKSKISLTHILQENVVTHIIVIILLLYLNEPIRISVNNLDPATIPDVMLATSILGVAAMFGAFSFSYENVNPYNNFDRYFAHITSTLLNLPIGIMFLFVQHLLNYSLGQSPTILISSIWLVYFSIILWDFGNVKKVEQRLKKQVNAKQQP